MASAATALILANGPAVFGLNTENGIYRRRSRYLEPVSEPWVEAAHILLDLSADIGIEVVC